MAHEYTGTDSEMSATDHWNEKYREKDQVWSGRPNAALVSTLSGHASGTALDVGCGEGGDSLWLAENGWTVTGIDVSTTALERASAAAHSRGLANQIELQHIDLTEQLPTGTFDLVSAIFLQSKIDFPREEILRSLMENVAVDGLFLVVSHAEFPPWAQTVDHDSGHDHDHDDLPSATETLEFLGLPHDAWEVLICGEQSREATGPDGDIAELRDAVVLVRRISA